MHLLLIAEICIITLLLLWRCESSANVPPVRDDPIQKLKKKLSIFSFYTPLAARSSNGLSLGEGQGGIWDN